MLRKLIAGATVAGALTLGLAGVAGAATSTSNGGRGGTVTSATASRCSGLSKLERKVHTVEGKVLTLVPKTEALEAKAKTAGKTKLAHSLAKRIAQVQRHETKVKARLAKAEAKCGTSATPSTS